MSYKFRPANRAEAKPLIGLYSESGAGKTLTALMLARGFVGPQGRIGMIETEGGRGEAYQGDPRCGEYLVRPIRGNFSPQEYGAAISEAEAEKLDALIIDSASHEWEGAGGVLAMAAENDAAGKKGVLVWQKPKIEHQRHFMLRLMQSPIPLIIVCMRAKYPMEQKGANWVRSNVLEPKQAADILFEMFVHAWIDQEHKLHVTKYTVDSLRKVFIDGERVTIETGQRLAAWARGTKPESAPQQSDNDAAPEPSATVSSAAAPSHAEDDFAASIESATTLEELQRVGNEIRASKLDATARSRLYAKHTARKAALTQARAA